MQRINCLLSIVAALLLFAACTTEDTYNDNYRCNLYINNAVRQDATLASAMNPASPGVFVIIKATGHGYQFTSNQGQTSPVYPFSALDVESGARRVGMNNGLIVGYGNLSSGTSTSPYNFYAFDAECPVCFDFNALPLKSYRLTVNTAGIATCANCKRQFNLNTGGNCINNKGQLNAYRAMTTGPFGILQVR